MNSLNHFALCAVALFGALCLAGEVPIPGFRPPAIPIVTSDPHVQNWIRADTTTENEGVTFWDGRARGMVGSLRIDGTVYRWLGVYEQEVDPAKNVVTFNGIDVNPGFCDVTNMRAKHAEDCNRFCVKTEGCRAFVMTGTTCYLKSCVEPRVKSKDHDSTIIIPDADAYDGQDIAPGRCDISHKTVSSEGECAQLCAEADKCQAYVIDQSDKTCYLKSCTSPVTARANHKGFIPKSFHPVPPPQPKALTQKSVTVYPTRTVLEYELPGVLGLTVTTLNTMFPDDLLKMSMPTTTITLDVRSLDGKSHTVEAYLEALASHTVDDLDEEVVVNSWKSKTASGAKVGSTAQNVFGVWGDHVNIDWGYLYLGTDTRSAGTVTAGAADVDTLHKAFEEKGTLPQIEDGHKQPARQGPLAIAVAHTLGSVGSNGASVSFVYAYDDITSVYYFGQKQKAYWTTVYDSILSAIDAAFTDYKNDLTRAVAFDKKLLSDLAAKGGDKYATICGMAYRQTIAATKVTWNSNAKKPELFLKEISTNGDMQTADVVFPASPLFLYVNATLLQMLIDPLMRFANNETWNPYTDPYCPHQIGVFPVANDTTAAQEEMPMENTGNMFLMMLAILQRNGGDVSFYYPKYFKVMTKWADYLKSTLPFPENQLCTDDFMGAIPNNTNLAAKGIIALNAYAELCYAATKDDTCRNVYQTAAINFAKTWLKEATVDDPTPHTVLSFTLKNTWSTKYNMLWQRILKMKDVPFPNFDELAEMEVSWYLTKAKEYGTSLDIRNDWCKIDWLSWASALTKKEENYNIFMNKMYNFLNTSPSRCPLTDLYVVDTGAALGTASFVARPVVGGFFAKALL